MNLPKKNQVLVLAFIASFSTILWISGCAGVAEPLSPLSITPNVLSVSAKVGSASSQMVSLTNTGAADVSVSQAILSGTGFSVSGLATPLSLPVGQSKSFAVEFTAPSVGDVNGTLTIITDMRHRPVVLSLHGSGGSGSPKVASVSVTPLQVSPAPGGKVLFTAAVEGTTTNEAVTWTTSMGSITSTGIYTAPAKSGMGTVTATSVADPTKSGSAVVMVTSVSAPIPAPTPTPTPVSPTPAPVTPGVTGVTVSPATASSITSGTLSFAATVLGTTTNTAVTWKAALGSITSSGAYTAPAKAGTDTVTATSVADTTKSGSATVTVTTAATPVVTSIAVTPASTSTTTGNSVQFAATVQGTVTNTSVTWKTSAGSISASGMFTAPTTPGSATVTATSVADPTKSASASVTFTSPSTPPSTPTVTSVTISPTSASATTGGTLQFSATVQGTTTNTAVSWKAALGSVSASGLYTAPSKAGTDTVTATSDADSSKSASASVTVSAPQQSSTCGSTLSPTGGVDNNNWQNTIAAAIQASTCVEVKAGTYNLQPYTLVAGTNLQLDDGVTVSDTAGYSAYVPMFEVAASNISITGVGPTKSAVFTMPITYATNIKDQGDLQYNHCFFIQGGASNVTLSGFSVNHCGGDGFDLGGGSGVTINGVTSSTNIRQGLSVTNAISNVTVSNSAFNTNFASGIDLEPDSSNSLTNMAFDNDTTSGNPGGGISFGLYNLVSGAEVSITVNNFQSTNDQQYCVFFVNGNYGNTGSGSIHFTGNTVLTGCGYGGAYGRYAASGPQITFDSLSVINSNRSGNDPHFAMDSAVGVELDGGQTGPSGGVTFNIQTISNNTGNMVNYFQMGSSVNTSFTVLSGGSVSGANSGAATVFP
jgi:hypothetical protein